jgi:hypothetical protein
MGAREVRTESQRLLDLRKGALVVPLRKQREAEPYPRFGIVAISSDTAAR